MSFSRIPPLPGGDGMLYAYQTLAKALRKAGQAASEAKGVVADEVKKLLGEDVYIQRDQSKGDKVALPVERR